jgi:hypothetical protein
MFVSAGLKVCVLEEVRPVREIRTLHKDCLSMCFMPTIPTLRRVT